MYRNTLSRLMAGGALALVAHTASAVSVVPVADDAALVSLLGGTGEPLLDWVAEGRIGDRLDPNPADPFSSGGRTFELDIGVSTGAPADQADVAWSATGQAGSFSLDYLAATGVATVTVVQDTTGTVTFTVPVLRRDATDLFLRINRPNAASGIIFTNFTIDDATQAPVDLGTFSVTGPGATTLAIWRISGFDYTQDFSIDAGLTFLFDPLNPPQNSQLAFQAKFGNPVPVPAAVWLLGSALAGLGALGRRRS